MNPEDLVITPEYLDDIRYSYVWSDVSLWNCSGYDGVYVFVWRVNAWKQLDKVSVPWERFNKEFKPYKHKRN